MSDQPKLDDVGASGNGAISNPPADKTHENGTAPTPQPSPSSVTVPPPAQARRYTWGDRFTIWTIGLYTWLMMLICLTGVMQLHFEDFSTAQTAGAIAEGAATAETVAAPTADGSIKVMTLLLWPVLITPDTRLMWLVLFAGALGALVHSMRSYAYHLARRSFGAEWLAFYLLRPFAAAALAALLYAALRSGLLTASATIEDTNTFGFVVIAGLTGLFFEQAMMRFKRVGETIFDPAEQVAPANPSGAAQ